MDRIRRKYFKSRVGTASAIPCDRRYLTSSFYDHLIATTLTIAQYYLVCNNLMVQVDVWTTK